MLRVTVELVADLRRLGGDAIVRPTRSPLLLSHIMALSAVPERIERDLTDHS